MKIEICMFVEEDGLWYPHVSLGQKLLDTSTWETGIWRIEHDDEVTYLALYNEEDEQYDGERYFESDVFSNVAKKYFGEWGLE